MGVEERRVGPYRLERELGRGASGVVWEAVDEKLGRRVALKVLADEVAATPDQRARFEREARLLAAIAHPHVAAVYGVVEEGERLWIALEHLDGESLADELERGPLPLEEALDVARQVADGLEAAHESGVVHRDLKPANVVRAADGTAKVLDFGLAKPVRTELGDSSDLSSDGLVIGTPRAMAPEQLRGRPVDRRADLWAFGCLLYELLTGVSPFDGETGADVVHAILEGEPDLGRLPARTPRRVRELLARCLTKDRRARLRDAGEARVQLELALAEREWTGAGAPGPPVRRSVWVALVVAVFALALVLSGVVPWPRLSTSVASTTPGPLRLVLDLPAGERVTLPRLTPDGSALLHEVSTGPREEERRLVLRRFDAFGDVPIPGSEAVDTYCFSPDGRELALVAVSEGSSARYDLSVVPLDGSSPPRFLMSLPDRISADGAIAWMDDGRIVVSTRPRGLLFVPADGEGPATELPVVCDETLYPHAPDVLDVVPGTRLVLASNFQIGPKGAIDCIVTIDADSGQQRLVLEDSRYAWFVEPGYLLFSRSDVLLGARFDAESSSLASEPVRLADGLRAATTWISGGFHASRSGAAVWHPGGVQGEDRRYASVDREGTWQPWSTVGRPFEGFTTIDESAGFVTAVVTGPGGNFELWGAELENPPMRQLLAGTRYDVMGGVVDLASRSIYFCRFGGGGAELRRTALDAPSGGELLFRVDEESAELRSPRLVADGRLLTLTQTTVEGLRLLVFDLAGEPPFEPVLVHDAPRSARQMRLSPDGRWLLVADRDLPPALQRVADDFTLGPPRRVPVRGLDLVGAWWARDVRASPYVLHLMPTGSDAVYAVEVADSGDGLRFSEPRLLLKLAEGRFFDAAHVEGDRYLGIPMSADEGRLGSVCVMFGGLDALAGE